ncbi:MAG TPA: hypothetical protein VGN52_08535 [Burkholderiales bacterium]|jgi:hypothetical protein
MQTSLDTHLRAHWHALHSDYVTAHQDYLDLKLQRDAAQGQVIDPNALLNARQHLETAHLALHEFCARYAQR